MSTLLTNLVASGCGPGPNRVLIRDRFIAGVGPGLEAEDAQVVDCGGKTLLPAFVDLHAHFRDPGLCHKEDIHSGCRAAVHGGYATVNLMPNTKPVCSSMETVRYVQGKARDLDLCDVFQTVSITDGSRGESLAHLDSLEGVRWLTDDGVGVDGTGTMLRAMELARDRGMGLMLHEEDSALSKVDMYLAEEIPTYRDVKLAGLTRCPTHFSHVSTIDAMEAIRRGKEAGAPVTCEVTPHHLALNDSQAGLVNPPLRGEAHRRYLIACVKEGLVDAIATDHAPHTPEEKAAGARGFTGLDLAFPTLYTTLVGEGHISLEVLSRLLSRNPARILGLEDRGEIKPGFRADLVLVDLEKPFVAGEEHIHSKSKNSPVLGMTLQGTVLWTMRKGRMVYEHNC